MRENVELRLSCGCAAWGVFKIQESFEDGYQTAYYSCPHWEVYGYEFSSEDEELILNKCSAKYRKASKGIFGSPRAQIVMIRAKT